MVTTSFRPPRLRRTPFDRPSLAGHSYGGSAFDRPVYDRPRFNQASTGRPSLRLTRRGRLVVLGFFILMASLASAILLATASRAESRETGPAPSVVVQPHDTLWSIATRTSPRRDPYAAVAEIKKINGIEGYVVHPGQTLELPRDSCRSVRIGSCYR